MSRDQDLFPVSKRWWKLFNHQIRMCDSWHQSHARPYKSLLIAVLQWHAFRAASCKTDELKNNKLAHARTKYVKCLLLHLSQYLNQQYLWISTFCHFTTLFQRQVDQIYASTFIARCDLLQSFSGSQFNAQFNKCIYLSYCKQTQKIPIIYY